MPHKLRFDSSMQFIRDSDVKAAKKNELTYFHLCIDEEVPERTIATKKGPQKVRYHPLLDCAEVAEFSSKDDKVLEFPVV